MGCSICESVRGTHFIDITGEQYQRLQDQTFHPVRPPKSGRKPAYQDQAILCQSVIGVGKMKLSSRISNAQPLMIKKIAQETCVLVQQGHRLINLSQGNFEI